jgi:hypothetical protein
MPDGPTIVSKSEAADEMRLGSGGGVLAAAVGQRLSTAGLIERVVHRATEPLEEFQRRNAHFRKKASM